LDEKKEEPLTIPCICARTWLAARNVRPNASTSVLSMIYASYGTVVDRVLTVLDRFREDGIQESKGEVDGKT
jgi:hypothetical protein